MGFFDILKKIMRDLQINQLLINYLSLGKKLKSKIRLGRFSYFWNLQNKERQKR